MISQKRNSAILADVFTVSFLARPRSHFSFHGDRITLLRPECPIRASQHRTHGGTDVRPPDRTGLPNNRGRNARTADPQTGRPPLADNERSAPIPN